MIHTGQRTISSIEMSNDLDLMQQKTQSIWTK